jgi:hypothetical protein
VLAGLFTSLRRGWWVRALSNIGEGRKDTGLLGVQHLFILRVKRGSGSGERESTDASLHHSMPLNKQSNINPTRLQTKKLQQRSHKNRNNNIDTYQANPTKCAKRKFLLKYIIYTSPPSFSSQSPICNQSHWP